MPKDHYLEGDILDDIKNLRLTLHDRMDRIETAYNRTPEYDAGDFGNTAKDAETWARTIKARAGRDANAFDYGEYRGALGVFLRRGEHTLNPDEAKALAVGSDPDGGYWVTPEVGRMVTGKIFESSPVRQSAAVQTIGSASLEIPIDDDEAAAVWVSETEARAETATPKIRKKEIVAHEMSAEPRSTQKLLDDANVNVEEWLAGKVASKFARTEATAFVNGTGVGQPRGILTYPAGTASGQIEQVNSGSASTLTGDGLIDLVAAVKAPYLDGAVWMMKRSTAAVAQKLKDGQGNYLWQESLIAGQPSRLLGHSVVYADDVPAVAADALAIIFGNFRAAYTIVDRFGIRVLRDPFTSKPWIKFYTTKRVGGDVVNFEALKIQKIAA